MCIETVYLSPAVHVDVKALSPRGSLYEAMAKSGLQLAHAQEVVTAVSLSEIESGLLHVPNGSPALRVTRIAFDTAERRIEWAETTYRADRYDIAYSVPRLVDE